MLNHLNATEKILSFLIFVYFSGGNKKHVFKTSTFRLDSNFLVRFFSSQFYLLYFQNECQSVFFLTQKSTMSCHSIGCFFFTCLMLSSFSHVFFHYTIKLILEMDFMTWKCMCVPLERKTKEMWNEKKDGKKSHHRMFT